MRATALGVLVLAALAVFAWANRRDDGGQWMVPKSFEFPAAESSLKPTGTPTVPWTPPQSSPTPGSMPIAPGVILSAPGVWQTREFGQNEPIGWGNGPYAPGLFFLDTATGTISGYRVPPISVTPLPNVPPGYSALTSTISYYRLLGRGKWVWGEDGDVGHILDRSSGASWNWNARRMGLLAASTEYLLFQDLLPGNPPPPPPGSWRLFDSDMNQIGGFEPDVPFGWYVSSVPVVSERGNVAFWTARKDVDAMRIDYRLVLYEPALGESRLLQTTEFPFVPEHQGAWGRIELDSTSDDFTVREDRWPRLDGTGPRVMGATETAFDWFGNQTAQRSGPAGLWSPDRRFLVQESIVRLNPGRGSEGGGEYWPAVILYRADGTELFRLRSATIRFGDGNPERRWLADSSGFLVMLDRGGESGSTLARFQYAIVRLDGSIERLPDLPGSVPEAERVPWELRNDVRGAAPHPTNPDLIAFGHTTLLDRKTGRWFVANTGIDSGGHLDPWSAGPNEMVFTLPHGGHGWGQTATFLPVVLERPPFSPNVGLRVAATTGCVNLRDSYSLAARIVSCIASGTRLELPPPGVDASESFALPTASGTWLYVTLGGWVNAAFVEWDLP